MARTGQSRAVSTIGPSSVIAIVCSEWAPREPSSLRIVQPSGSVWIWSVAVQEPRLDGDHQPRAQWVAATGAAVVGDVRVPVHRAADPVARRTPG